MKELKLSERGFQTYCRKRSIICFGGGLMFRDAVEYLDLAEQVLFVLDNDPEKQNSRIRAGGKSHAVYSVARMPPAPDDAVILITSRYFSDILRQLRKEPRLQAMDVAVYPNLKLYTPEDDEFYAVRVTDAAVKIYREFCLGKGMEEETVRSRQQALQSYLATPLAHGGTPFVIPRLVYILSSVCNLRCRHCLALMPLYRKPSHIPPEQLLRDITKTLGAVDLCAGVELIGGETFLYPHLAAALKPVLESDKVLSVILSTNGTVIPDAALTEVLKHPKIWIRMSDYGISGKTRQVAEYFTRAGVAYSLLEAGVWKDGGGVEYRGKDAQTLSREFLNCENARVSKTVYHGRLFVCPRSARLFSLGLYTSEQDYVELREEDSTRELREKLLSMHLRNQADACQHCDFGSLDPRPIPAGEQLGALPAGL